MATVEAGLERLLMRRLDAVLVKSQTETELPSETTQETFDTLARAITNSCALLRSRRKELSVLTIPEDANIDDLLSELFSEVFASFPRGSGFIVADNLLVTSNHVASAFDNESLAVEFVAQRSDAGVYVRDERNARIVATDERHDLALVEFEGVTPFPALPIGDSDAVSVGQKVLAMKNRWVNTWMASPASVTDVGLTRVMGEDNDEGSQLAVSDVIELKTNLVQGGDSGSPLIDISGNVIGVMTARNSESNQIAFAVSSKHVTELLRSVREGRKE